MNNGRIFLKRGKEFWMMQSRGKDPVATSYRESSHELEVSAACRKANPGREVITFCGRCGGAGRFVTGTLNGQPIGPGGECFRCAGKGYQTLADEQRNAAFDRHQFEDAMRGMMAGVR